MNIEHLIQEFENFDLKILDEYVSLISSKHDEEIFPPYIPHIGTDYNKHKIFMYGKAQSMSEPWSELINKTRIEKVRQMYDERDYHNIMIAPYKIMLSLAGIYIYAKHQELENKLQNIHNCVSATNYYKFSLSKSKKDINPDKKLKFHLSLERYWKTNDILSMLELETLNPSIIISFHGRHNEVIKKAGYEVITINDPSWILQGGSGVLQESGSWFRKIDDPIVYQLVDSYLQQIDGPYSGKRDAIKIYLLKYYSDWKSS